MNINATIMGQFIIVLAVIMALVCFYLGKRKTQTPILASIIGFLFSAYSATSTCLLNSANLQKGYSIKR